MKQTDVIANNELENTSFSATVVKDSFQRLDNISQENPVEKAKKSYKQFQVNLPEKLAIKDYTLYDWAELLWRPC